MLGNNRNLVSGQNNSLSVNQFIITQPLLQLRLSVGTQSLTPEKVTVTEKNQNLSTGGKKTESSNYAEDPEWFTKAS